MSDEARAERERIKAAGAVSACCGSGYARRPTVAGLTCFICLECLLPCSLIGVIA